MHSPHASSRTGFTLIELLVVIAIIAILAVVVVLTLNPAQLLAQSRDANRVSDMATLQSGLNLYTTDQSGSLSLGNVFSTYISVPDNASSTCGSLGLPSLTTSTGQSWACSSSSNYRLATSTGWVGTVNFNLISSGSPFGSLPVDPVNQTSSGLFYAYNTNGSQFQVTANLESTKYKAQYGTNSNTTLFPEVISGGAPGISTLYNPTGLIGYWPMDEGNGSSTIDQSGNNNGGTWAAAATGNSNTYYTGGKVGAYAGEFDGISNDDHVSLPSATLSPTTAWTVSAWIYPIGGSASSGVIISKWEGSSGLFIDYSLDEGYGTSHGQKLHALVDAAGGGSQVSITGNTTLTSGTWYYVTAVFNGSSQTLSIYVNGRSDATPAATSFSQCATNTANPYIGAFNFPWSSYQNAFTGPIDDVRLYNRALSPAEIMALYNAEK